MVRNAPSLQVCWRPPRPDFTSVCLLLRNSPEASVTILLFGRAVLGGAESFIITAAVSWGLSIV